MSVGSAVVGMVVEAVDEAVMVVLDRKAIRWIE